MAMAPSLGCSGGLFRRQSSSSSDPSKAEWRRKSVKLREGTFLHGELQVDIQERKDARTEDDRIFVRTIDFHTWDTRVESQIIPIYLVEKQIEQPIKYLHSSDDKTQ